jgi:two-component system, cell cycle sensor histidine kinase and response regulator CckA
MSSRKLTSGNSIRHRFTYTLIAVVTGILLLFSIAIILYYTGTIEAKLEKRLEDASNLAKSSLPSALWQFNHVYVNDFIDSIFLEDDLVFAKVLVAGAVVKEKLRPGFPQKDFVWFRKSPGFIVKEIDITYEGQPVGRIQLALSRQRIQKSIIINSVISIFLLAVIAAAISITIFFITRRYIFRPLSRLEGSAELISGGDLDASIDTSANDEIGNLARSFEQMIKNLKKITTSRDRLDNEVKERKQAEEALRDVERRNQALVDHSPVCHKIVDLDFNLTYMSANGYKMLQLDGNADVYGKPYPFEFFPAAFRNEMTEKLKKVKETGDAIAMEALAKDIEGNEVWLDSTLLPVLDDDRRIDYITVVSADTTHRKLAEEEKAELESKLQRAEKMEAMGLMAGGIAHDLNNILSGIVSYPELLLMDIPEDSPMFKPIKTIQESGMRAADVVEDLMTIARGVATSKEVMNFNAVVEEYLNSTEHNNLVSIRPPVTFKTRFDADLLNVNGSPTHIKKILMNLVTNASEAIEGSGTVIISTMNQYLDEPLRGYEDVVTGEYVMLTVSDDGLGISQQDLARIFEPFYTKKVMDRSGTGLGLAVVWNTVQDHKGYINVESSEKGTVFELYFPVTREELAAEKEEVPLGDYLGHGEKILVVDDEERQREIAGGILTKLGYKAEAVSSGEEAIEYVKEHPVDLIVLDMVMPKGINGRKTYEEIIKIHPGQKAIIASGYVKTKEVELAQELGAGKYIKKPYTLPKVGLAAKEELEK